MKRSVYREKKTLYIHIKVKQFETRDLYYIYISILYDLYMFIKLKYFLITLIYSEVFF